MFRLRQQCITTSDGSHQARIPHINPLIRKLALQTLKTMILPVKIN